MDNPLLAMEGLPPFSRIRPDQVEPAVDQLLSESRARIAELADRTRVATWDGFVEPLEEIEDRLARVWSPIDHLNAVMNSEELRAAHNACQPKLSEYHTEVGQNRALFEGLRALAAEGHLDATQHRLLDNALRDFRLAGVDLPADERDRFKQITRELAELTSKFEQNLLDATHAWSKSIRDESALAGMPVSALDSARQAAAERGQEGWVLTLDAPSYLPVMTYADDRALRYELYRAYSTRACDQGPHAGRWDNGDVMERILRLRHEAASLLGFTNYAERSLATKMARSSDEVMGFLDDLARRSLPQARRELAELMQFARERYGCEELAPWDLAYYSEKLRQDRHRISQEELRPYFPLPRVLHGMFRVVERLFAVRIREIEEFDTWHRDVRLFEIASADGPDGELRGRFYLDPYARRDKRGGAWMDVCINRHHTSRRQQAPVAYLVCNFTPPVADQPSLLTHQEVQTLFHEFGHGLHHMLTRVDYPSVAGINGVPWDAVELPSQFLENWCWERESLDLISGHLDTGEPIPQEMYERMRAAKCFQSGMQMVRQLEFALFDFRLYREYDPQRGGRIYEILDQVRDLVSVMKPPPWARFAHGFAHIFSGGYAAGYYSYKWAQVLSADAFSLFEEHGLFDHQTGRAFRENILERGGSAEAMDLYLGFSGRAPTIDALLRHSGILDCAQA